MLMSDKVSLSATKDIKSKSTELEVWPSSIALTKQAQIPDFKPQYHKKKRVQYFSTA
jgi:hypothetical protein